MDTGQGRRGKSLGKRMRNYWRLILVVLICIILGQGCKNAKKGPETLPRPSVGYLHWLEKDSMLNQSAGLIGEVSQSGRVWLQGSEPARADVLLEAAPNWLYPVGPDGQEQFLKLAALVAKLPEYGIYGLYMGDLGEKPNLLKVEDTLGLPAVSQRFDGRYGTEKDYENLALMAENAGVELGSQLLPAATGQGPDFLLQARNAPGYSGLYAMVPVDVKTGLPLAKDEWDFQIVPDNQLRLLESVIPYKLARDSWAWASKGGWAVTGAVAGVDGQPRRWLYRYSDNISRPVLAWQDPSGLAARVFSSSVIRLTGLLGQSLTGLSLEPMLGLEPENGTKLSLSPGIDAIGELARQIHRYGGWAMQVNAVPKKVIEAVLSGPCDFCRDDLTELLVAFGLAQADGRPIAALYREWIKSGLDIARLARGLAGDVFTLSTLKDNQEWNDIFERLDNKRPFFSLSEFFKNITKDVKEKDIFRRFVIAWRMGMPGLFFLDAGSLNNWVNDTWLINTLKSRKMYKLAQGKVKSVTRGQGGGFGLLTALPSGGYWLLACNFGIHADQLKVSFDKEIKRAMDVGTGENLASGLNPKEFSMPLDGHIVRNVLLSIR